MPGFIPQHVRRIAAEVEWHPGVDQFLVQRPLDVHRPRRRLLEQPLAKGRCDRLVGLPPQSQRRAQVAAQVRAMRDQDRGGPGSRRGGRRGNRARAVPDDQHIGGHDQRNLSRGFPDRTRRRSRPGHGLRFRRGADPTGRRDQHHAYEFRGATRPLRESRKACPSLRPRHRMGSLVRVLFAASFESPDGRSLTPGSVPTRAGLRQAGQESTQVFSRAVATGKRADHGGLLRFGGRRVDDVPAGLPFTVTGDDRQWRGITSCFWPVGMSACHAGSCTTRPPSTRQCASFHRFLCSQPFQRSKCSALCVKGASAGDGARGSLRPAGPFVWSKVRRSLRAREPARHRATLP